MFRFLNLFVYNYLLNSFLVFLNMCFNFIHIQIFIITIGFYFFY